MTTNNKASVVYTTTHSTQAGAEAAAKHHLGPKWAAKAYVTTDADGAWVVVKGKAPTQSSPTPEATVTPPAPPTELAPVEGAVGEFVPLAPEDAAAIEASKTAAEAKPATPHLAKSTITSPVKTVWAVCEANPGMRRKDLVAKCVEMGIAYYTARTQIQAYKAAGKTSAPAVTLTA